MCDLLLVYYHNCMWDFLLHLSCDHLYMVVQFIDCTAAVEYSLQFVY